MRGTYDITYIQGPIRVEKDIFGPISSMRLLYMKVLILLILKISKFRNSIREYMGSYWSSIFIMYFQIGRYDPIPVSNLKILVFLPHPDRFLEVGVAVIDG